MGPMHKVACNKPEFNRGLIEGEGVNKLLINASIKPPHVGGFQSYVSSTNSSIATDISYHGQTNHVPGSSYIVPEPRY